MSVAVGNIHTKNGSRPPHLEYREACEIQLKRLSKYGRYHRTLCKTAMALAWGKVMGISTHAILSSKNTISPHVYYKEGGLVSDPLFQEVVKILTNRTRKFYNAIFVEESRRFSL